MQVKNVMTRRVKTVSSETTLERAAERMRTLNIGVLPVRDGDDVVGIVTDRDMTVRAIAEGLDPKSAAVYHIMTPDVVFCFEDQSVEQVANLMATHHIRRVLVLDRAKKLAGIVSLDDLAAGAGNSALVGETLEHASARPAPATVKDGRHRILVALDGSAFAEHVLPSVEFLARKLDSTVILLRVVAPAQDSVRPEASVGAVCIASGVASITDEMRCAAARYLRSVQQRLQTRDLKTECEQWEGPAGDVIVRRARELGVDLIAMTTHARTGVDRMLFGSNAEDVLHRAPCPVLIVRVPS